MALLSCRVIISGHKNGALYNLIRAEVSTIRPRQIRRSWRLCVVPCSGTNFSNNGTATVKKTHYRSGYFMLIGGGNTSKSTPNTTASRGKCGTCSTRSGPTGACTKSFRRTGTTTRPSGLYGEPHSTRGQTRRKTRARATSIKSAASNSGPTKCVNTRRCTPYTAINSHTESEGGYGTDTVASCRLRGLGGNGGNFAFASNCCRGEIKKSASVTSNARQYSTGTPCVGLTRRRARTNLESDRTGNPPHVYSTHAYTRRGT